MTDSHWNVSFLIWKEKQIVNNHWNTIVQVKGRENVNFEKKTNSKYAFCDKLAEYAKEYKYVIDIFSRPYLWLTCIEIWFVSQFVRDPIDCFESNFVYMGVSKVRNATLNQFAERYAAKNEQRNPRYIKVYAFMILWEDM